MGSKLLAVKFTLLTASGAGVLWPASGNASNVGSRTTGAIMICLAFSAVRLVLTVSTHWPPPFCEMAVTW